MPGTAPLERYIKRALADTSASIFKPSQHVEVPTLFQGETAYILTYRGCFNPPHQAHKDTLCHGFFRGGDDLNIVAAIVYFVDDKSVRSKYAHDTEGEKGHVFTQAQRINLFDKSGLHGGWHWCFPNDIGDQFDFQAQLCAEAAADGYQVRFITLTGPDHVGRQGDDRYYPEGAITVGTGHPERMNFRAETETGLRRLSRYHEWQMLPLEQDFSRFLGTVGHPIWLEQKLQMLFPQQARHLPTDRK
jgi:hypothetical protein